MSILETVRTALESMGSNLLRTLLTMLGVIIGVASVVTLLALGAGVQASITSQIQQTGTNLLTINADNRPGASAARLTNADVAALADPFNVPGLEYVVPQVNGSFQVATTAYKNARSVMGTTSDYFTVRSLEIEQGQLFTRADDDARLRVAVLGSQAALDLFPGGGVIGQSVLIGSVPFRVVGVAAKQGGTFNSPDDSVYVPISVAQEKLMANRAGGLKSVSSITVQYASSQTNTAVSSAIQATLRRQHNLLAGQADDFRIMDSAALLETLTTVTGTLTVFLGAIGGIALLVGGIGIMNIMLVSVTERTREIGLRKAVGAPAGAIRLQFLIEALTVTVIAGTIGILLAAGASWLIGQLPIGIVPAVQSNAVLLAFGVSVLIGVVFGFYPAWRASRMSPVEALRYE
jgi:putative ABC transport system permease protein